MNFWTEHVISKNPSIFEIDFEFHILNRNSFVIKFLKLTSLHHSHLFYLHPDFLE